VVSDFRATVKEIGARPIRSDCTFRRTCRRIRKDAAAAPDGDCFPGRTLRFRNLPARGGFVRMGMVAVAAIRGAPLTGCYNIFRRLRSALDKGSGFAPRRGRVKEPAGPGRAARIAQRGRAGVPRATTGGPNDSAQAPKNVFEREATVAGWDEDYYHKVAVRYYDRALADLLRRMGVKPGDLVLDAGCGPGVHAIRAATYGARVRAVDLSETMLAHARARAQAAGVAERIEFSQADLTRLSLASGAYPFVFSWGVVIHVPDAEAALDHLARVVAPGGRLALQVSNEASLDFSLERLIRRLTGRRAAFEATPLGTGLWYEYNDDRLFVRRFNTAKLVAAMAERGLRLVDRRGAEFSEFQRRAPARLRPLVLRLNRLAYDLKLPAGLYCTVTLIFEKR
jgi:2-polyprenyl-3-methyl-5-hydroxy-6-metoxy-1,4-benzoquinol methylase